jgi:pimeloyl-ACP methyl ester carboxylesterase
MLNHRLYGKPPYSTALIHGGPGAPGSMETVAKVLAKNFGILEPLQTKGSIEGQIQELHSVLKNHANFPVTLVGHSWGAWLSFLFAAKYPDSVNNLILIGSGPFEERYVSKLKEIRFSHFTAKEREKVQILERLLIDENLKNKNKIFTRFGTLMSKADSYDPLPKAVNTLEFQPEIYQSVWHEAGKLRRSGELLKNALFIKCPVVAIHGDYDTHPADGVIQPLSQYLKDFRYIILDKCGHEPWNEKHAKDQFYKILFELLQ